MFDLSVLSDGELSAFLSQSEIDNLNLKYGDLNTFSIEDDVNYSQPKDDDLSASLSKSEIDNWSLKYGDLNMFSIEGDVNYSPLKDGELSTFSKKSVDNYLLLKESPTKCKEQTMVDLEDFVTDEEQENLVMSKSPNIMTTPVSKNRKLDKK